MICCESSQCSDGYISTISTKGVERKSCQCSDSLRWDKPCSSFDCPRPYFRWKTLTSTCVKTLDAERSFAVRRVRYTFLTFK